MRYLLGSVIGTLFVGNSSAQSNQVHIEESSDTISLENNHIRLLLSKENGGIKQIKNLDDGVSVRDSNGPNQPKIWDIRFYSEDFSWLSTAASQPPTIQTTHNDKAGEISLTWEKPRLATPDDSDYNSVFDATITITIKLGADDTDLVWEFDVENRDTIAVRRVQYPIITDITSLDDSQQDSLVLPINSGREVSNPTETDSWYSVRYPTGFGTMQFSAYRSPSGGFYVQSTDTEGYVKEFSWGPQGEERNLLQFYHQFDMPREPGSDVVLPYELQIGSFSGNWYDAADQYRTWVENSGVLPEETKEVPDWYYEQGASVRSTSYRRGSEHPERETSFETTVERLIQTREQLDTSFQILWNGYQTHGKYGYGDWVPPYEGWESFRDSIKKLERNEISPAAFVGSANLYERSDLWQDNRDEASQWVIKDRTQSYRTSETMGFTVFEPHLFAEGWVEEIRKASQKLVSAGVNQIWFDGVPWGKAPNFDHRTCYADEHDHPVGTGGKWWANRVKNTYGELKSELREINDTLLLSGEGIAETFIPEIDIQHTRDPLKEFRGSRPEAEPIPLTRYILGDHLLVRGNITAQLVTSHQYPSFVRLGLARALNWGTLPGFQVAVHRDADELLSDELIGYASRIAKQFQLHGQRFLTDGNMLRKPIMESRPITVRVDREFLGREEKEFESKALQTSAWESEDGKERAILLTNIDSNPIQVEISLTDHPFSDTDERLFYLVRNGVYESVEDDIKEEEVIKTNLSQDDVLLLVSSPPNTKRLEALDALIQLEDLSRNPEDLEIAQNAFLTEDYETVTTILAETKERTATETNDGSRNEGDQTSESTGEATQSTATTGKEAPGFGISSILGALGGVSYLLKSKLRND